jgi:hypothetical protein
MLARFWHDRLDALKHLLETGTKSRERATSRRRTEEEPADAT